MRILAPHSLDLGLSLFPLVLCFCVNAAAMAIKLLNYTPLRGRTLRIMPTEKEASHKVRSEGNVFVKNLPAEVDERALHELFEAIGPVLSVKVSKTPSGKSKGFGFVQFWKAEDGERAIRLVSLHTSIHSLLRR